MELHEWGGATPAGRIGFYSYQPPPANPARDTSLRNGWKSQSFRKLVSVATGGADPS